MGRLTRIVMAATVVALLTPAAGRADCASDCQESYHNCRRTWNADSCLSEHGLCLIRCTLDRNDVERHGAIAYSLRKEVYGYSQDYDSAKTAGEVALRNCRSQERGADDCRVLVTFHNACGALALGDRGAYGSAWGQSAREASAKALNECRPYGGSTCKIERQVCSGAGR